MRYIPYLVIILVMMTFLNAFKNQIEEKTTDHLCGSVLEEPTAHTEDYLLKTLYQKTTYLEGRVAAAQDETSVLLCTNREIESFDVQ